MAGAFSFGMEEEYFLVDAETKLVVNAVPTAFFEAAKVAADGRIGPEFLQPQVEVTTSPHRVHGGRAQRAAPFAPNGRCRWRPSTDLPFSPPARIPPQSGAIPGGR